MSSVLNALYTMFVGMTASFYNIFLFFFFVENLEKFRFIEIEELNLPVNGQIFLC